MKIKLKVGPLPALPSSKLPKVKGNCKCYNLMKQSHYKKLAIFFPALYKLNLYIKMENINLLRPSPSNVSDIYHLLFFLEYKSSLPPLKTSPMKPGMVAHTCNSNTWEAKAGGWRTPGQPGLIVRPRVKQQQNKTKT
jgi:hypothetical protein